MLTYDLTTRKPAGSIGIQKGTFTEYGNWKNSKRVATFISHSKTERGYEEGVPESNLWEIGPTYSLHVRGVSAETPRWHSPPQCLREILGQPGT